LGQLGVTVEIVQQIYSVMRGVLTVGTVQQIYSVVHEVLTLIAILLASSAALLGLIKIRSIIKAVELFNSNRDRISSLRETADSLKVTLDKMNASGLDKQLRDVDRKLTKFQTELADMPAKVQTQLADLTAKFQTQLADMSAKLTADMNTRLTETQDDLSTLVQQAMADVADETVIANETDSLRQKNWEEIKNIWLDVRNKLEARVKRADQRRYRSMRRYDYSQIIDKLADDGFINHQMKDDAKQIHDSYLSFRNGRLPIPDAVKVDVAQHKARFDDEFEAYLPSPSPAKPPAVGHDTAETKPPAFDIDTTLSLPQVQIRAGDADGLRGNGRLPPH
jgi:hypothetical protein